MRYEIDIENNDSLTVGDVQGLLEVTLHSMDFGTILLHFNELQLNELISAIDMIKALRPKKSGLVDNPRAGIQKAAPQDWGYNETSHTDNPNG